MLASIHPLRSLLKRWVPLAIAGFAVAHVATQWAYWALDRTLGGKRGLVQLFDVCDETNLPTAFSSLLLLSAAGVLGVVTWRAFQSQRGDAILWLGMALAFVFLSFDEAAGLHERWSFFLRHTLGADGLLLNAWVIPYALLVGIAGLVYLRFILRLPADTRWRFIFAGSVFVSAALGLEIVESLYETAVEGELDARYAAICGAEEIMEMSGVALFIDALLRHLFVHEGIAGLTLVATTNREKRTDAEHSP